jgi:tetratricopeptide (TPR) repeat protein
MGMDGSDLTFGLGVNVSAFGLDYASFSRKDAGSSQPVSFTMHYGKTLYEQRRILAARRAREEQELIKQAFFNRIRMHKSKAKAFEADGKISQALDEWKIVLEYVPGDSEAVDHIEKAKRQIILAQEKATRDIELQTKISTHFSLGLKYYSDNDYPRARDEWREVLKLAPDHKEALAYMTKTQAKIDDLISGHMRKAREYEKAGRLTEAIGEWNNVTLLDPGNEMAVKESKRIKMKIDIQSKDYAAAARKLKAVNLYNKALKEFSQGEYEKTLKDLNELLRLDPNHAEAKNLRIMVKRKLTPLTREEEEQIRRLYLKGMQYFAKDQYREAIAEWEKILKIDPANESVKRNIQEAKERLKKLEGHTR